MITVKPNRRYYYGKTPEERHNMKELEDIVMKSNMKTPFVRKTQIQDAPLLKTKLTPAGKRLLEKCKEDVECQTEQYPVERGIPFPIRKSNILYPFKKMDKVGDSFFVPCNIDRLAPLVTSIRGAARRYSRLFEPDFRVTILKIKDRKNSGVRVWRIEP